MRTKYSIINSAFALGGQILYIVISFITRTLFIRTLGVDYLGVNGLFTNILSILSFAELGIGTSIIFALYKPFAEDDHHKVSALMNFYAKAYHRIGLAVAFLGIAVVPFLDYLIKDKPDIPYLALIYLLFLLNSVASYFFVYKRSLIIVSQNGYINSINQYGFLLLQNIAQIVILLITGNYIYFLITQIICTITSNILISNTADKMFPFIIRNRDIELDVSSKKNLSKNVIAMVYHKLGSVVVSGTDNILISSFVGITWVGLYSNYLLITNTITSLLMQIFNAVTASVGNLNAKENNEKSYAVYNTLLLINLWFFGFCSITFGVMINNFIELWIGEKYLISYTLVMIIIVNFFIYGMRQTSIVYINTYGLFWQIRYKSFVEAIVNLSVCLFFLVVLDMGIYGVLLGTTVSTLLTNAWWEPYVVYKHGFEKHLISYFKRYILYALVVILNFGVTYGICELPNLYGITSLVYRGVVCLFISNGIFLLAFHRTSEYKELMFILKSVSINLRNKIYNTLHGRNAFVYISTKENG